MYIYCGSPLTQLKKNCNPVSRQFQGLRLSPIRITNQDAAVDTFAHDFHIGCRFSF